METFKDYDVEECKRLHYKTQPYSIYYALYKFIDEYSGPGKKCRSRTIEKFCLYTTFLQSMSYGLTSLLIIRTFILHSFDALNTSILFLSIILSVFVSLIQFNYFPKYNDLDITLILLQKELRSFIWILGFTKFDEYKTWRDNSISNRLFKIIIERIKYACTINQDFNKKLLTWINVYCAYTMDFHKYELDKKLEYLIKTRDTTNELIRILQLVMVTEINDIATIYNPNNNGKMIPEDLKIQFEHCKDAWVKSLFSLLTKRNSKFRHSINKVYVNELISTIHNGLYDIEDKFKPLVDEKFITKKYRDYIRDFNSNFNDSLTAF